MIEQPSNPASRSTAGLPVSPASYNALCEAVSRAVPAQNSQNSHDSAADSTMAVALLAVDNWSEIQHQNEPGAAGQIIAEIERRLRGCLRLKDLVRCEQDGVFLLALPDVLLVRSPNETQNKTQNEPWRRLRAASCETPIDTQSGALKITVSIGITSLSERSGPADLLKSAQAALGEAQAAGGNRVSYREHPAQPLSGDETHPAGDMLPVCTHCKSIRLDDSTWCEIEHYVAAQTGATLSHGICPKCLDSLYPEE